MGWEKKFLYEIAQEHRETYEPNLNEHRPYIGLEHIDQQSLILNSTGDSASTQSTKRKFNKGDILFGSLRPYFRKVVQPNFDGVCSTDITVIKKKDNNSQKFLRYLISSEPFIKYATNFSNGSRMPRANWNVIKNSSWLVPDTKTQNKIASILSAYDDLIENNNRRIKILEEMAQAIYKEWFVNFRFPGHEDVKFVDSELGKIPAGWEVKKLSELVESQYGYTESTVLENVGPKYLRGTDINKSTYIDWDQVPYCKINEKDYKKYKLKKGDIVVIRMADPGKTGIVEQNIDAVFASYLIRLNIVNYLKPYYLFYFLNSDSYQNYIRGASTGTTRKSASAGVVKGVNIIIPSENILDLFENYIRDIREEIVLLLRKNVNLRKTRELLLPKLMSGEIDVEEMEIEQWQ